MEETGVSVVFWQSTKEDIETIEKACEEHLSIIFSKVANQCAITLPERTLWMEDGDSFDLNVHYEDGKLVSKLKFIDARLIEN